jgi:iturin family lipopeptide synthetase A
MIKNKNNYNFTGLEIAVIGMAGRFPGANNINDFWNNLKNGVESISFFADEELLDAGAEQTLIDNPNFVKAKGIINGKENFDLNFFGYIPDEVTMMDPQIRVFHECVWEALEDAGYNPYTYKGLIGLYAGAGENFDWEALSMISRPASIDHFSAIQLRDRDFLTTRISYKLSLNGPAVCIKTACSTSLVAIHMACRGLLLGDCTIALAGGVTVGISSKGGYLHEQGMVSSPDGHCRAFDVGAEGSVWGDGAAVVVLRKIKSAMADRDNVLAVIKGSAINNDGERKIGFSAPSVDGQAEVIRIAQKVARVEPQSISYIEAHGTGTPLGDAIEMEALNQVFGKSKGKYCGLGSVKTNIGHLDTAAGIAGFIKVVLSLKHKQILPSLHFVKPNPEIDFGSGPFYVNTGLKEWKNNGQPLRAGISSFGIGGTNAHVILEEMPVLERDTVSMSEPSRDYKLILLSAKTESALDKMTENFVEHLNKNPDTDLADIAYTMQTGRKRFYYRRKLLCSNFSEAIDTLSSLDSRKVQTHLSGEENKPVVFMFSGLGLEYVNMGLGLYQKEPVFRKEMDKCFTLLQEVSGIALKDILYPADNSNEADEMMRQVEISQYAVFIFAYSLANLLISWGINPEAMIGYSFGEYVAACISGVFSLKDILILLNIRAKLLRQLPGGMMLSVPLSAGEVEPLLADELSIGIDNGASCVVSGSIEAVRLFEQKIKERKLLCMPLDSSHGIHSKLMEPIIKEFERQISKIPLNPPQLPYISTVTGDWIKGEDAASPVYWARQLRATVRFSDGIKRLLEEPDTIFLEVGPGREISALVRREIDYKPDHRVINLVRHPRKEVADDYFLLDKIGLLWLYGVDINWSKFYSEEKRYRVSLPTYPFERRRFWKLVDDYETRRFSNLAERSDHSESQDISDWFYIPLWSLQKISNKHQGDISEELIWLIFTDDFGLGDGLANRLETGHQVVTVRQGLKYLKESDCEYTINPREYDDYTTLLTDLNSKGLVPNRIIHAWTITNNEMSGHEREFIEECQDSGFYSLLYLGRALNRNRDHMGKIEINVVTNNMQEVTGEECLHPGKTTILAPCKVIPQEYPNIRCRSIDVVLPQSGNWQEGSIIERLIEELKFYPQDKVVAHRGNFRWLQAFKPVHLNVQKKSPWLKEEGVYLIIGGLGNIGYLLAEYIIKSVRARIILTGRSDLPPGDVWEELLSQNKGGDKLTQRLRKLRRLLELQEDVVYYRADVTDRVQMQEVIQQAEKRFGKIDGIINAAGIVEGESINLIEEIDVSQCKQQFQSKLYGLLVLAELLSDKELDFCLMISSLASVLGGLRLVAYTAANLFLDAFSRKYNQRNREPWIIFNLDDASVENIIKAFRYIFYSDSIEQVIFSRGGDLGGRISRWIQLESLDNETKKEDTTPLYSRPKLSNLYEAPGNAIEQKLADIWGKFFGLEKVGITDDFFDLGGDSLKAINIISIIHKEMNVVIPLKDFFNNSTIQWAARYITGAEKDEFISIKPAETKEYYAVSSAQKRLYILQLMDKNSTGYNEMEIVSLAGNIDKVKLEEAFRKLIKRHESLRTSVEMIEYEPVQRVHDEVEFTIGYHETGEDKVIEVLRDFVKPFDMTKPPFFRVKLIKAGNARSIIAIDIHHIICDGVSHNIFLQETIALFSGKKLPALTFQYIDYVEWQNSKKEQAAVKRQEKYWLAQFEGEIPVLELPNDFPRPAVQSFEGSVVPFALEKTQSGALKRLAEQENVTFFMLLIAVFNVLLSKLSGQQDIIIGTPTSGRRHPDLQQLIGILLNTLALRHFSSGDKSFRWFLSEVRERTLQAFENQDYPFEDLVEQLAVERDLSRNPLFDVMFIFHNELQPTIMSGQENKGLDLLSDSLKIINSPFDITFRAEEIGDRLTFKVEYYTRIFEKRTIEKFIDSFKRIISIILEDPARQISTIEIIGEEERRRVLYDFNDTRSQYHQRETIHRMFSLLCEGIPGHTALKFNDQHLTYMALEVRAHSLANLLIKKGVKPQTVVGLMVPRSLEMMAGLLGILKAGGIYLPIDPENPAERITYMLKDSETGILLASTTSPANGKSMEDGCQVIDIFSEELSEIIEENLGDMTVSTDLAYVIYTSGSTGRPKGVMIEHQNVINFVKGITSKIDFSGNKIVLALTTISFDIFALETVLPLLKGLKIVIVDENEQKDPRLLADAVVENHVAMVQLTPSTLKMLKSVRDDLDCFKKVTELMVGGEAFPDNLFKWLKERFTGKIYNLYGPTETTIWSTLKDMTGKDRVEIGGPISNTVIYIIDPYHNVQPIGIAGDLYIGGHGVGRGYLNRAEITDERFTANAFLEDGKIYRTGDLARWRGDGNVEFLGRVDHQVKIRGFRIELGEIENQLLEFDCIQQVVVEIREDQKGDRFLCAYYVSDRQIQVSTLRDFLSRKLPTYMMPSFFVPLDKIPLTPNGKIDRKALPEPEKGAKRYVAPGNEIEEKLQEIWSEVLIIEREKISIDANFFELGGHSLKAVALISQIHKKMDVRIFLSEIFKAPTIGGLSSLVEAISLENEQEVEVFDGEERVELIL